MIMRPGRSSQGAETRHQISDFQVKSCQVKSRSGDDLKELLAATTIVKALQSLHSEQHQLGREWINPLSQSETHKAVNWRML